MFGKFKLYIIFCIHLHVELNLWFPKTHDNGICQIAI